MKASEWGPNLFFCSFLQFLSFYFCFIFVLFIFHSLLSFFEDGGNDFVLSSHMNVASIQNVKKLSHCKMSSTTSTDGNY